MEGATTEAEVRLADAQNDLEDPAITADAERLAAAYEAVSQEQVDALYARWTELESKKEGDT